MISPQVTHPLRQLLLGGVRGGVKGGRTPVARTPAAQQNKICLRSSFDRSLSRTLSRTQNLYTNGCTDTHTSSLCATHLPGPPAYSQCVPLSLTNSLHELKTSTQICIQIRILCTKRHSFDRSLSRTLSRNLSRTEDFYTNIYTDTHTLHSAQLIRQVHQRIHNAYPPVSTNCLTNSKSLDEHIFRYAYYLTLHKLIQQVHQRMYNACPPLCHELFPRTILTHITYESEAPTNLMNSIFLPYIYVCVYIYTYVYTYIYIYIYI